MIIRGGENVYPVEIEDVSPTIPRCSRWRSSASPIRSGARSLTSSSAPSTGATIDPRGGRASTVGAGWPATRSRSGCRRRGDLPKNPTGKIQKGLLRLDIVTDAGMSATTTEDETTDAGPARRRGARLLRGAGQAARAVRSQSWGEGTDDVIGVAPAPRRGRAGRGRAAAQAWQRELFDAGLAWVDGPIEYGGRGLDRRARRSWCERWLPSYEVPNTSCFMVSHEIVGPTILEHGTAEQKERWLPRDLARRGHLPASCSPSPRPAPTWPACARRPSATATTGWSTGRRCGRRARTTAARRAARPHRHAAERRHRAITAFLVEMDSPASTSGRCGRSPEASTSTRCSSTTCVSRTPTGSARSTAAGRSRRPRSAANAR